MRRTSYSFLGVSVSAAAALITLALGCGDDDSSTGGNPDADLTFDSPAHDATSSDAKLDDAGSDVMVRDGGTDAALAADAADAVDAADASATDASDAAIDAGDAGGTILLFAGSATALLGGELHPGGSWTTTPLSDSTAFGTSLTMTSAGVGVGVYTSSDAGTVSATIWNGTWSTPASITSAAIARDQPFVDATGGTTAHLIFQDTSFKFDYLAYSGSWATTVEPLTFGGVQSFGPVPAGIAALGANAAAGFTDGANANHTTAKDRIAGSWQASVDVASNSGLTVIPSIIPLSAGPELMLLYVRADMQVMFTTRTAGTWAAPAAITSCLTGDRVAIAPLPSGGAILAFRGTDTKLYWSVYASGNWSAIGAFATPNVAVARPPAVAHGIAGDTAEIAFIEDDGSAYHARLASGAWSAPVLVGGTNLIGVAIASSP